MLARRGVNLSTCRLSITLKAEAARAWAVRSWQLPEWLLRDWEERLAWCIAAKGGAFEHIATDSLEF